MRPSRRNVLLLATVGMLALSTSPPRLPDRAEPVAEVVSSVLSASATPAERDEAVALREARIAGARATRHREAVAKAAAARQAAAEAAARAARARKAAEARRAAQSAAQPVSRPTTARPSGTGRTLSSTAYCLTGRMANGSRTYRGAVAGNAWPLGTRLYVSDGPYGAGVYTVADRIGHGSSLDFAMPGDCSGARSWGRRSITVRVV